jgi:formate dehydrogenase iron-sulfur subunit
MVKLTRRDFLKICGAGAVTLGAGAKMPPSSLGMGTLNVPQPPRNANGVLIDTTKCMGCQRCQVACQSNRNLPTDTKIRALSPVSPSVVQLVNVSTDPAKPVNQPVKHQCMNCINPACVAACTVGALQKRLDGPVVYDSSRCIGCRYCMYACPFGVPTFEWNKQFSLISKCDSCVARIDQGKLPACVEACPVKALTFGKREELLTIANQRIYGSTGNYQQHIYGEHEIGGTSMLYISAMPPEEAPAEINATIMHSTPTVGLAMAMALSGIYWLVRKRHAEQPEPVANQTENGG